MSSLFWKDSFFVCCLSLKVFRFKSGAEFVFARNRFGGFSLGIVTGVL